MQEQNTVMLNGMNMVFNHMLFSYYSEVQKAQ